MTLGTALRELQLAPQERVANDPVRFPRRYSDPLDQEIAAFLAAGLAYGRVAGFSPAIEQLLSRADAAGGPRRWVERFDPRQEGWLDGFQYRWNRGADHRLLLGGLRDVLGDGTMGALVHREPDEHDLSAALSRLVHRLRGAVLDQPGAPVSWRAASHGLRYLLPEPAGPGAAKRIWMFARWMVRPDDGVDLGLWTHLDPVHLVVPLDTHVHRIARLVGLTSRRSSDRRAAVEITRALRRFDPDDPVRFDFSLAHLGISGGCRGQHVPEICGACAIRAYCRHG